MKYLNAKDLVERWRGEVSEGTLANWRSGKKKRGPAFVKLGSKVLYPMDGLEEYERKNRIATNDNHPADTKAA